MIDVTLTLTRLVAVPINLQLGKSKQSFPPQLVTSTMLKQRFQTILNRLRRVFKKKSGTCADACTEASTDVAQSEHAETSVAAGSSSTKSKSSDEAKSSIDEVPAGEKEQTRSGSSESGIGSDDLVSRLSESPTVPRTILQLPTIVVGEDLEPLDLQPRRDSSQLVRLFFYHSGYILMKHSLGMS